MKYVLRHHHIAPGRACNHSYFYIVSRWHIRHIHAKVSGSARYLQRLGGVKNTILVGLNKNQIPLLQFVIVYPTVFPYINHIGLGRHIG